jgi:predicted molibdopterin-dependent oxidoreductase YjgC
VLLGVILHRQSQIIDRWYAAANVQCVVASRCVRVCKCVGVWVRARVRTCA